MHTNCMPWQETEGLSFQKKTVDEKKADYDHANKEVCWVRRVA